MCTCICLYPKSFPFAVALFHLESWARATDMLMFENVSSKLETDKQTKTITITTGCEEV